MKDLPPHPEVASKLSWLLGTWRSEDGLSAYPTMSADLKYGEEVTFSTVGQPMLNYRSVSWHGEMGKPMHQEAGFVRIQPGTQKVSFFVAHNFGLTTIEEGTVGENTLELVSTSVERTKDGEGKTKKITRNFQLQADGKLKQVVFMETVNTPLTKHLEATYTKL